MLRKQTKKEMTERSTERLMDDDKNIFPLLIVFNVWTSSLDYILLISGKNLGSFDYSFIPC